MFKRKAPINLEVVQKEYLAYVASIIKEYQQQIQAHPELRVGYFTSRSDFINLKKQPRGKEVFQILTNDVAKEIVNDKTNANMKIMMGINVLQSMPIEYVDNYVFIFSTIVSSYFSRSGVEANCFVTVSAFYRYHIECCVMESWQKRAI